MAVLLQATLRREYSMGKEKKTGRMEASLQAFGPEAHLQPPSEDLEGLGSLCHPFLGPRCQIV
jgi:hypothetical protein